MALSVLTSGVETEAAERGMRLALRGLLEPSHLPAYPLPPHQTPAIDFRSAEASSLQALAASGTPLARSPYLNGTIADIVRLG